MVRGGVNENWEKVGALMCLDEEVDPLEKEAQRKKDRFEEV